MLANIQICFNLYARSSACRTLPYCVPGLCYLYVSNPSPAVCTIKRTKKGMQKSHVEPRRLMSQLVFTERTRGRCARATTHATQLVAAVSNGGNLQRARYNLPCSSRRRERRAVEGPIAGLHQFLGGLGSYSTLATVTLTEVNAGVTHLGPLHPSDLVTQHPTNASKQSE
jgi:hypothetical protein